MDIFDNQNNETQEGLNNVEQNNEEQKGLNNAEQNNVNQQPSNTEVDHYFDLNKQENYFTSGNASNNSQNGQNGYYNNSGNGGYNNGNYNNGGYNNYNYNVPDMEKKDKKGMAIASMVLGILSIVCCCSWWIQVGLGVAGLVLGIISYKENKYGFSIAGIVTASIGLLLGIISLVFLFMVQDSDFIMNIKKWSDSVVQEYESYGIDFIRMIFKK